MSGVSSGMLLMPPNTAIGEVNLVSHFPSSNIDVRRRQRKRVVGSSNVRVSKGEPGRVGSLRRGRGGDGL